MKHSIKTKVSAAIALVVLLTVAMISLLSNYFINEQFENYITRQQELKTQVIISSLSQQYKLATKEWDLNFIHTIGMLSIYDGYIIKVYDVENNILWDAQAHDMSLCTQIMDDISERMLIKYPKINGEFTSNIYHLTQGDATVGAVNISYFGPYFLSENDFQFLNALNTILIGIGIIALVFAVAVGHLLARRLSQPILKTVEVTKQIADGNYSVRMEESTKTKEVDMLIHSINHLAGSLEKMEKLRKQLTEDVAHELRTPITVLQAHIEAMVEGVWQPTMQRLESCYEETVRIGKLVSDLENLAMVESDSLKLDKTEIDLYDIIHMTVNSFETEINNKNLDVSVSGSSLSIFADCDRIRQVLVNLLSNAVKYSNDGGRIKIELFETKEMVGFHIIDNGMGVSEEELPFLFERFYRADKSRNRMTGGSGIGLAIVKSIVEAHGGKVKVESKINEGSRFEVTLPK